MSPRSSAHFALLLLAAVAPTARATSRATSRATPRIGRDMAIVPAGSYRPLYASTTNAVVEVASFAIDKRLVTREQFQRFVDAHPEWRRGSVRPTFAEADYLADWATPTDPGVAVDRRRPVTNVSWFAARAYCAARGKRLPTTDEWEYLAAASETKRDASKDQSFMRRLSALYAARPHAAGITNVYGVGDMHAPVWEWTLDFNAVVLDDDSRATGSGADARDRHLYCASAALGATDPSDYPAFLRHAVRAGLGARSSTSAVGFRCAASTVVS